MQSRDAASLAPSDRVYKYLLASKYLLSRPINLIGTLGIAVSVWALIVVVSIFTGYIDVMVDHIRGTAADLSYLFPKEHNSLAVVVPIIEGTDGVLATAPRQAWYGLIDPEHRRHRAPGEIDPATTAGKLVSNFFQIAGINNNREAAIRSWKTELRNVTESKLRVPDVDHPFAVDPTPSTDKTLPGIILGYARAGRDEWGLKRGDTVTLTSARPEGAVATPGVAPVVQKFYVCGAFKSRYFEFENATAFVDIDVMRRLFPPSHKEAPDVFTEIAIVVDPHADLADVQERLRERLAANDLRGRVFTWQQRPKFTRFLENVDHQRGMMKLVLFVLPFVSCFLIFATLMMMVGEKTRDIGVIASLGGTRRGILSIFVLCGLAISVAGSIIGVGLAILTCQQLNHINDWISHTFDVTLFPRSIYGLSEVPYALEPLWMAQVMLGAIVLTLLFSLIPSWLAARLDPVQALRRE